MYIYRNLNPYNKHAGDCVIRALANVMDMDWVDVYDDVTRMGKILKDMPSSNNVWGAYLKQNGYKRHIIPNTCPDCYTVKDFCRDNARGKFILYIDGHVVSVINGNYYDTYDSGDEIPLFYWSEE